MPDRAQSKPTVNIELIRGFMTEALLRLLLKHPLFQAIKYDSVAEIGEHIQELQLTTGQVLCHEGDKHDGLYIIKSGSLSIKQHTDWGDRELCVVKAPELCGEMEALRPSPRLASIIAKEACTIVRIDPQGFDRLVALEPGFVINISRELVQRIRQQDSIVSNELFKSYRALTFALANLTDSRDPETGSHLARTRNYCALLAEKLSHRAKYKDIVNADFVETIYNLSPLHDIGKVAVPDVILRKPTALNLEEFEIMKLHTTAGAMVFEHAIQESDNFLFRMGKRICLHHHERWDGGGYPLGLTGEAIPLEARIMTLADVYDALLSRRVYKQAFSYDKAIIELKEEMGLAFDPELTSIMLDNISQFQNIHEQFYDGEPVIV